MNMQTVPADEGFSIVPNEQVLSRAFPPSVEFEFEFLGRKIFATTMIGPGGVALDLVARLAPVPYSADGIGLRQAVKAIIAASELGDGFRFVVSRQQQIYFLASARIAEPVQPAKLLTAAIGLLMEAKPYVETLRDALPNWGQSSA